MEIQSAAIDISSNEHAHCCHSTCEEAALVAFVKSASSTSSRPSIIRTDLNPRRNKGFNHQKKPLLKIPPKASGAVFTRSGRKKCLFPIFSKSSSHSFRNNIAIVIEAMERSSEMAHKVLARTASKKGEMTRYKLSNVDGDRERICS